MNIYESWMVKKKIAHRGLHDDVSAENSLSSFQKAIDGGYAIEMDLQMTLDGVVVVFHDDTLNRVTGFDADIRKVNYSDIKDLKLSNSEETIPTCEEFLKFIDGRTPLLIEIKDHSNIGVMEEKIKEMLDNYKGEFAVQSFNPFIVKWFATHCPIYVRGQLASTFSKGTLSWIKRYLLKNLMFIRSNKSQFVSYDVKGIDQKLILRIKKRMPILMWTVRSQEQIEKHKDYFDNIIFENFIPKE